MSERDAMRDGVGAAHAEGAKSGGRGAASDEKDAVTSATDAARVFWRSIAERATPEPAAPWTRGGGADAGGASLLAASDEELASGGVSRRDFLRLMGASMALAGLGACARQPLEEIFPYVRPPEEIIPGKPLFFATAATLGGIATGILVESHMGRPTKVEGNPEHPASLGATDAFAQASILGLYDPDRSQTVTRHGSIATWSELLGALHTQMETQREKRGAGLRILTETVTSPTLLGQIERLIAEMPEARWDRYDPLGDDAAREGALLAFGENVRPIYRVEAADVILSLDADFLACGPGSLRHAREFAARRRLRSPQDEMSRLYVVESSPTNTGAVADHRLAVRAREVEAIARAILPILELRTVVGSELGPDSGMRNWKWIQRVAEDLGRHRGRGLVVPGECQSPAVHAIAHTLNAAFGNVGETVSYVDPVDPHPVSHQGSIRDLVEAMRRGEVEILLLLSGNPVYNAPADVAFADGLRNVAFSVHLGLYHDETAALCQWHVNQAHSLECWSDARAHDGTATILQPLIAPLYGGKSAHEMLAAVAGDMERSGYDVVRDTLRGRAPAGDFEAFWRRAVHDGLVSGTAFPTREFTLRPGWTTEERALGGWIPPVVDEPSSPAGSLEILFRADPTIHDGRFANNGWLQELPKPLTQITWENAALVSPATAAHLGVASEDLVELRYGGRSVRAPIWVLPGHADDAVTVHLGYGRTRAGRVGTGCGFDAYALRTADSPWFGSGLDVVKTGQRVTLACTQHHHGMEGRGLVRAATLEEFRAKPHFAHEGAHGGGHEPGPDESLYPPHPYEGYAWGMAIDLGACIGCNACIVACQAENNIPIVGKEQVARGREMQWLRVDRYYTGDVENPTAYFEPVPCMHCEDAPCEVVCPVAATVHGDEGLNEMVYNRCVGTRYCSNNCPYKVRRFNFYQFTDRETETFRLMRNPDVTVRDRGVMEKCTYCVQRINEARIDAKREERPIRDGDVVTACQAVCPAGAIVFGDINDKKSRVAALKADPRNYGLLAELNTRPRTTYLAAVRNPNPELGEAHS